MGSGPEAAAVQAVDDSNLDQSGTQSLFVDFVGRLRWALQNELHPDMPLELSSDGAFLFPDEDCLIPPGFPLQGGETTEVIDLALQDLIGVDSNIKISATPAEKGALRLTFKVTYAHSGRSVTRELVVSDKVHKQPYQQAAELLVKKVKGLKPGNEFFVDVSALADFDNPGMVPVCPFDVNQGADLWKGLRVRDDDLCVSGKAREDGSVLLEVGPKGSLEDPEACANGPVNKPLVLWGGKLFAVQDYRNERTACAVNEVLHQGGECTLVDFGHLPSDIRWSSDQLTQVYYPNSGQDQLESFQADTWQYLPPIRTPAEVSEDSLCIDVSTVPSVAEGNTVRLLARRDSGKSLANYPVYIRNGKIVSERAFEILELHNAYQDTTIDPSTKVTIPNGMAYVDKCGWIKSSFTLPGIYEDPLKAPTILRPLELGFIPQDLKIEVSYDAEKRRHRLVFEGRPVGSDKVQKKIFYASGGDPSQFGPPRAFQSMRASRVRATLQGMGVGSRRVLGKTTDLYDSRTGKPKNFPSLEGEDLAAVPVRWNSRVRDLPGTRWDSSIDRTVSTAVRISDRVFEISAEHFVRNAGFMVDQFYLVDNQVVAASKFPQVFKQIRANEIRALYEEEVNPRMSKGEYFEVDLGDVAPFLSKSGKFSGLPYPGEGDRIAQNESFSRGIPFLKIGSEEWFRRGVNCKLCVLPYGKIVARLSPMPQDDSIPSQDFILEPKKTKAKRKS